MSTRERHDAATVGGRTTHGYGVSRRTVHRGRIDRRRWGAVLVAAAFAWQSAGVSAVAQDSAGAAAP
jgi:hypothetical protein